MDPVVVFLILLFFMVIGYFVLVLMEKKKSLRHFLRIFEKRNLWETPVQKYCEVTLKSHENSLGRHPYRYGTVHQVDDKEKIQEFLDEMKKELRDLQEGDWSPYPGGAEDPFDDLDQEISDRAEAFLSRMVPLFGGNKRRKRPSHRILDDETSRENREKFLKNAIEGLENNILHLYRIGKQSRYKRPFYFVTGEIREVGTLVPTSKTKHGKKKGAAMFMVLVLFSWMWWYNLLVQAIRGRVTIQDAFPETETLVITFSALASFLTYRFARGGAKSFIIDLCCYSPRGKGCHHNIHHGFPIQDQLAHPATTEVATAIEKKESFAAVGAVIARAVKDTVVEKERRIIQLEAMNTIAEKEGKRQQREEDERTMSQLLSDHITKRQAWQSIIMAVLITFALTVLAANAGLFDFKDNEEGDPDDPFNPEGIISSAIPDPKLTTIITDLMEDYHEPTEERDLNQGD